MMNTDENYCNLASVIGDKRISSSKPRYFRELINLDQSRYVHSSTCREYISTTIWSEDRQ